MATSPNYSWPEPDNTDLVKNGALAMRTLGNAIDTTMATMTPKSTVTAKGSLIAATAASTPANLAVGNNGETLVADSSTSTGLRYQSAYNGNAVINGGMDLAQRGTSFAISQYATPYTLDRWQSYTPATTGTWTVSQVASGNSNFKYAAKLQRTASSTQTGAVFLYSSIESQDSIRFASQPVVFSFYAKAGANASLTGLSAILITGTGTDQNAITGFTGSSNAITVNPTLTTSWQRFSGTATLGAITQIAPAFTYTPSGTAGADDSVYITGVQVELGSVATTFKRSSGGTIQGELAACQRYYWRNSGGSAYNNYISGVGYSTTETILLCNMPVTMRVAPTVLDYASLELTDSVGGKSFTSISINQSSASSVILYGVGSTGLTQFRPYLLRNAGSTSGYLGLGAEL